MEHPTAALYDWLIAFMRHAERGEIAAVSAGAGQERGYSYLHYRTSSGEHSTLVFRSPADGHAEVHSCRVDADQADVAARVDWATHGPVAPN